VLLNFGARWDVVTRLHGFCFSAFAGEWLTRTAVAFAVEWKLTKFSSAVRCPEKKGRGVARSEHRMLVFGAVEVLVYTDKHGYYMERAGRLRLAKAERADEISIRRFLSENVELGTEIDTDQWRGYSKNAMRGYRHEFHHPETHALHIHRVFGNLQTWLNGTHHGVDAKYLQNYLDEFVFRFNRRQTPMAAFQTLLGLTTQCPHVSLKKMTEPESAG
jgi:hypothetical protein